VLRAREEEDQGCPEEEGKEEEEVGIWPLLSKMRERSSALF
jgi:hypothetical protein